ncbi:hypothetical protein [Mycobacterium parmense]|uniref:hypothetical protein n=1 Tax=Mycobacterium parmense TaxID=185642 RepID=UPI001E350209|nr:hypothetical protein [Mycobacterium parmense]
MDEHHRGLVVTAPHAQVNAAPLDLDVAVFGRVGQSRGEPRRRLDGRLARSGKQDLTLRLLDVDQVSDTATLTAANRPEAVQ